MLQDATCANRVDMFLVQATVAAKTLETNITASAAAAWLMHVLGLRDLRLHVRVTHADSPTR